MDGGFSSSPPRGRTVTWGDLELYYEDTGVGRPLVLLHGFGGSSRSWLPYTAALSTRFRLIVIDLRGHGHSTNPDNVFTHRQAARDVFQLLDHLKIDRFLAMGISSGGMTLLHMATSQPRRIDSMVLVSATTHFPDQARAIFRAVRFDRMPAAVQAQYRDCASRGEEQILQLIAQFNAFHLNHDDMDFNEERLATVRARTLIVHGDRDRFFPVEIAENLSRWIPKAALWTIPGGEHVPIDDPAVPFVSTAMRFLEEGEGTDSGSFYFSIR